MREDRAPHWGYELLAPMLKDRRKLYRPRPLQMQKDVPRKPVPQLPRVTAHPCDKGGGSPGGHAPNERGLLEHLVRLAVTRSGPEVEDPVIALPLSAATLHTLEWTSRR